MNSLEMSLVEQSQGDGTVAVVAIYTVDGKPVDRNEYEAERQRLNEIDRAAFMADNARMDAVEADKRAEADAKAEAEQAARDAAAEELQEKLGLSPEAVAVLRGNI